ncbi:MBL fold metallo-hydrolase [Leifsonia sp. EB34]|uniref:MBL fold metallo-hydrolase n=1 Tax=Leifsonia sp. EB34 TaxID=3156303 RepID=UPI003517408A
MSDTRAADPDHVMSPGSVAAYSAYYLPHSDEKPSDGAIRVTFYGTSTLLFDDGTTQFLIDAFITRPDLATVMASLESGEPLIQTDEAAVDSWLARPEVGSIAAVFPAHSHHDHAIDVAYIARRTGATVHGSESTLNIARGGDVPEEQLSKYVLGARVPVGDFTVTVLPGRHPLNPPPLTDDRDLTIDAPLRQPARFSDYVEGGSFAFLIEHGSHSILVQVPGYIIGVLDQVRADVLFLSTVPIGAVSARHTDTFYDQIVGNVRPSLVVPVHWDDFLQPVSADLPTLGGDVPAKFDYLIERLNRDGIRFGIMQGNQSVTLFDQDGKLA